MNEFTSDRYELRQGRFIIVPTSSGDYFGDVPADFNEESENFSAVAHKVRDSRYHEYGYDPYIFEGYIVVDGHNDGYCIDTLNGITDREEAEAKLAVMKAEFDELDA